MMEEPKYPGTVIEGWGRLGYPIILVRVDNVWISDMSGLIYSWGELEDVEIIRTGYRGN